MRKDKILPLREAHFSCHLRTILLRKATGVSSEYIRRYSKIEVPIHFIWATVDRRPLLSPNIERFVHRVIQNKAEQLETTVLAINGMPDHVHLAVLFSPNISIQSFVRQVKQAATLAIKNEYGEAVFFRWEPGYAAFGFPLGKARLVVDYVQNQKTHHDDGGKLIGYWEEVGEWRDSRLQKVTFLQDEGGTPTAPARNEGE